MNIAIIGAGGVGGFLAQRLSQIEETVYLTARGNHLQAIRGRGICVETKAGRACAHPADISDNPADFSTTVDAVLFCVKGYDLEAAARSAAAIIGPQTLLLPLGNGVGNAALLKRLYPDRTVANGAIYIVSHLSEPGVVKLGGRGALIVMGMPDRSHPPVLATLAEALQKATDIKVHLSDDIVTDVWKKYLLIAAMGTLTSCHDLPMGPILQRYRHELESAFEEIRAVGEAEGARLDDEALETIRRQLERVPHDAPTSMWLDFQAGRKTELEQLTGYVIHQAQIHGIETPVMRRCYEKLKTLHT